MKPPTRSRSLEYLRQQRSQPATRQPEPISPTDEHEPTQPNTETTEDTQ
jgi:hypothetical protein